MKLKDNFFETENMLLLESLPDGLLYSNILMKMYLKSLKSDGKLLFNDLIPYNAQMIASVTRHQVGTVEKALQIFESLGLIDVLDGGVIYMTDIELFIGKSSTEGERKKRSRLANKNALIEINENESGQLADICPDICPQEEVDICPHKEVDICPHKEVDICPPEIRDKRLDININKKRNIKEKKTNQQVDSESASKKPKDYEEDINTIFLKWNKVVGQPRVSKISPKRKKGLIKLLDEYDLQQILEAIDKIYFSDFLSGRGSSSFVANFDWFIKPDMFLKVIEGAYDNKPRGKNNFARIDQHDYNMDDYERSILSN